MMPWEDPGPQTMTVEIPTPDGLLRVEQTMQTITWEDADDEHWRFTDAQGHDHAYDPAGARVPYVGLSRKRNRPRQRSHFSHYPTLVWVVDHQHYCLGNEGLYAHDMHWVEDGHWECLRCHQHIEPGHGPGSKTIPVSRTATLTEETATADLPPGWAEDQRYIGQVTWQSKGGQPTVTRTRILGQDEAETLMGAQLERDRQRERDAEARTVKRKLGYPPSFGEDL